MKIKAMESDILMFDQIKGKVLMSLCKLFIVDDVTIEEIEEVSVKKSFFSRKITTTTTKQKYVVGVKILSYHTSGKFIGHLNDDAVLYFLYRDLYRMRQNWIDFKDMLNAFGFTVIKTPQDSPGTTPAPQASETLYK